MTIIVSSITFPSGQNPLDEMIVEFSTDAAWDAGSVILINAAGDSIACAYATRSGLDGTAIFPPACVPEGSFTVYVLVASTTDQGKGTGGPMVVVPLDPAVDIPYTAYIEVVKATLIASAILPELTVDNVVIHRRDALDRALPHMNPGVLLVRNGFSGGDEFHTIDERLLKFSCLVLTTNTAVYDGEADTEERQLHESLSHRCFAALDANRVLGGVVHMPLGLDLYDTMAQGRVLNATQFWESLEVIGWFLC